MRSAVVSCLSGLLPRPSLVYGVNKDALSRRLSGAVAMDARVGPETAVLSKAEEDAVEDALIYACRHFLSFGRQQLIDAVRVLCLDGRPVP
ncbi:unnamed protein product [Ectocarpus sp. CCAP 1310/34]|nr:unnamed protein product [Ectocarpus sp. CCAP 1310/34]